MKVYCQNCGKGMSYRAEKPNFCSSCGNPISIYAKENPPKPTTQNQPTVSKGYEFHENLDIESDPEEQIPQLDGLDFEIEEFSVKRSTLGQILEGRPQVAPDFSEEFPHLSNNANQSEADFLKEFQKEAGPMIRDNEKNNG